MGIEFSHSFTSDTGVSRKWELRGPASTATSVVASGRGHVTIRWQASEEDEFAPFMPSEARVSFYDTASDAVLTRMIAAIAEQDYSYELWIYEGVTVIWKGYVETGAIERDEDGNKAMILTATDGLRRLEEIPYTSNPTTLELYSGRATVISILSTVLNTLYGFQLDIYTACQLYPRKDSTQLTAIQDPLANIYLDRGNFRIKDDEGLQHTPVSCSQVLETICLRFGLQIAQWNGGWWLVQQDLLTNGDHRGTGVIRRWKYTYLGVASGSPNYADWTHFIAPSDEKLVRTPATLGAMPNQTAVRMNYNHGSLDLIRNPTFAMTPRTLEIAGWVKTGTGFVNVGSGGSNQLASATIPVNFIGGGVTHPDNYLQGAGAGSWDAIIAAKVAANLTAIQTYDTETTANGAVVVSSGTQLWPQASFECVPISRVANGSTATGQASAAFSQKRVAMQIRAKNASSGALTYLTPDGTWSSTVTWLWQKANYGYNTWVPFPQDEVVALAADSYIRITLGPCFDVATSQYNAQPEYTVQLFGWDTAQILPIVSGELNPKTTSTINYIARGRPRVKVVEQFLGDGPATSVGGAMTSNATAPYDDTDNWKEGNITGAASGDSIDMLLGRIHLRQQNQPRLLHNASYHGLSSLPGPHTVIKRSTVPYAPLELEVDYVTDTASGRWYRSRKDVFTDDLDIESTIEQKSLGAFGDSGAVAFALEQHSQNFFNEASRMITRTTAEIPAGTGTTVLAVEALTEDLLHDGDQIVIISPNLSYNVVTVVGDVPKGAASITIATYDFPARVGIPASIYFVESELLTLARLGEQGFAVTVNATPIGTSASTTSGPATTLSVNNWIASLEIGDKVWVNGVELTLTVAARRGASTITFSSATIDVTATDPIYAAGQSTRAEFLVSSDKITAFVNRVEDQITTVSGSVAQTGLTFNVNAIPAGRGLKAGDVIFIVTNTVIEEQDEGWWVAKRPETGKVQRRILSADAAAGATSISVTSSVTVYPNDVVNPSYLAGLRVDFDGVGIESTHLRNTGADAWNGVVDPDGTISSTGTQGWIITRKGDAEFHDVIVRGTIKADAGYLGSLSVDGTLTMGTAGKVTNPSGTFILDKDGLYLDAKTGKWSAAGLRWENAGQQYFQIGTDVLAGVVQSFLFEGGAGGANIPFIFAPNAADLLINTGSGYGLVLAGREQLKGVSAPGGSATYFTQYADQQELPKGYVNASGPVGIPITWYSQHAIASTASSTAETSLVSTGKGTLTLPANHLVQGATFRVKMRGRSNGTATNHTIRLKLGGTTLKTMVFPTPSISPFPWTAEIDIVVESISGSNANLTVSGTLTYNTVTGAGGATTTLDYGYDGSAEVVASITSTRDWALTQQMDVNSAFSITSLNNFVIEQLY